MPKHTNTKTRSRTRTHGDTPNEVIELTPRYLGAKPWAFLNAWAANLSVRRHVLLKRILLAAVIGQLYAEKIPEI